MLRALAPAALLLSALLPGALALADRADARSLRVASYALGLSREGPGLLLQELTEAPGPRARTAVASIQATRPDVLVVQQLDHDLGGLALAAFAALLAEGPDGIDYPYRFAPPVNAGVPSGLDIDGDGETTGWADGHGWGRFPGHGGMAVLSRLPLDAAGARTFRELLWETLPDARMPRRPDGSPFLPPGVRLSSRSHWDVPVVLPSGERLHLLASHPTPPLYDGPEGRNRLRNAEEIRFWSLYLDGVAFRDDAGRVAAAPEGPLVVIGDLGLDPFDGAGDHATIAALLAHPRLQDPEPASAGAAAAAAGGAGARHAGPAALDTADFRDEPGPGNLRVDYVLPSTDIPVAAAGVHWPADALADGPPHRLVWVDLLID